MNKYNNNTMEETELTQSTCVSKENTISVTASHEGTITASQSDDMSNTTVDNDMSTLVDDGTIAIEPDDDEQQPQMRKSFRAKLADWFKSQPQKLLKTYAKRNAFTNVVLSAYLLISALLVLIYLIFIIGTGIRIATGEMDLMIDTPVIFCILTSLLNLEYTYKFVILNKKETILPSIITFFIASFFLLLMIDFLYITGGGSLIPTIIIQLLIIVPVVVSLRIKKYGASAWTLLDVPRSGRHRGILGWSELYVVGITLAILCVPLSARLVYIVAKGGDRYRSVRDAEIGDYLYEDETVSKNLQKDKRCLGIIYSLNTTKEEQEDYFYDGRYVKLEDISSAKLQWAEEGCTSEVNLIPDYEWKDRDKVRKDFNGREYFTQYLLYINTGFSFLIPDDSDNSNRWDEFVPTAAEWIEIIKNLGEVEVDDNMHFDAATATENLRHLNIDAKSPYWTISESDEDHAWSVNISKGAICPKTSKSSKARVRLVGIF